MALEACLKLQPASVQLELFFARLKVMFIMRLCKPFYYLSLKKPASSSDSNNDLFWHEWRTKPVWFCSARFAFRVRNLWCRIELGTYLNCDYLKPVSLSSILQNACCNSELISKGWAQMAEKNTGFQIVSL